MDLKERLLRAKGMESAYSAEAKIITDVLERLRRERNAAEGSRAPEPFSGPAYLDAVGAVDRLAARIASLEERNASLEKVAAAGKRLIAAFDAPDLVAFSS